MIVIELKKTFSKYNNIGLLSNLLGDNRQYPKVESFEICADNKMISFWIELNLWMTVEGR